MLFVSAQLARRLSGSTDSRVEVPKLQVLIDQRSRLSQPVRTKSGERVIFVLCVLKSSLFLLVQEHARIWLEICRIVCANAPAAYLVDHPECAHSLLSSEWSPLHAEGCKAVCFAPLLVKNDEIREKLIELARQGFSIIIWLFDLIISHWQLLLF